MPKKTLPPVITIAPKDFKDAVLSLLDSHADAVETVLTDIVFCEDAAIEIKTAQKKIYDEITELILPDFEDFEKLLDFVKDHPDYDEDEILERLDEDTVIDYSSTLGDCIVINGVTDMNDKQKLQDFINENIYPYNLGPTHHIDL